MKLIQRRQSRSLRKRLPQSIEALENRIVPAGVFRWNVDASGAWNNPANWTVVSGDAGVGYPSTDLDSAQFGSAITANRTITIPDGVTVAAYSIEFDDNNNYTIASAGSGLLKLSSLNSFGQVSVSDTAGTDAHVISAKVELAGACTVFLPANTSMTFSGAISETSGTFFSKYLSVYGGGNLTLSGSSPNTFTGGIYMDGVNVSFSKSAGVPALGSGPIVIGDGSGAASSARLTFVNSGQTTVDNTIQLGVDGELSLGASQQTVSGVSFDVSSDSGNGLISMTAGGKLTLNNIATYGSSSPSTAFGRIDGTLEFTEGGSILTHDNNAPSDLIINGPIVGNFGFSKAGAGTLDFTSTASSTYTGTTTINAGTLLITGNSGDGTLSTDIVVNPGAKLQVAATFVLKDAASLTLNGNSVFQVDQTEDLASLHLVSDATGSPQVQIAGGEFLTLRTNGQLTVDGAGTAPSVISGLGTLRFFEVNSGIVLNKTNSSSHDLTISAKLAGLTANTTLAVSGDGAARLSSSASSLLSVTLTDATLIVDGTLPAAIALDGGTLKGFGTVGAITAGGDGGKVELGTLSLDSGNLTLSSSSTFGLARGSGTGSLRVTGTVALNGATLDITNQFLGSGTSAITIIVNDGNDAVSGRFAGLPNDGDVVVTPRGNFAINYNGGTGNDVTITPVFVTPTISADGKTATYTDVDGDLVTVKTTKGKFEASYFTLRAAGAGALLQDLNLSSGAALLDGARITFSAAIKGGLGDKHVDVARITASGMDLAGLVIPGNLDNLSVGDADVADKMGLGALMVDSVGLSRLSSTSQPQISVTGPAGAIVVKGGAEAARFNFLGGLKSLKIGGSAGANSTVPGGISVTGSAGSIFVGGDLLGGTSFQSGTISATGDIGSLTIKGSLQGGSGTRSGAVEVSGKILKLAVGGSLIGGSGERSGEINADGGIIAGMIAGSVFGGEGKGSGSVAAEAGIGMLTIGGDVVGGDGQRSGSVTALTGKIAKLTVKGSVLGNALSDTGILARKLGAVTIGKDLRGQDGGRVLVSADGLIWPGSAKDALMIGSLTVGGSVFAADVLAGYNHNAFDEIMSDAQIGSIMVKGNWAVSRALAGVVTNNGVYGDADDRVGSGGSDAISSRIAKIVIGGTASGTAVNGDLWGFEAQEIGAATIGGKVLKLKADPAVKDVLNVGPTGDVVLREV